MKKLLITSTDLMMIQFLAPHVEYLSQQGFQVELACSEVGGRMDDVLNALTPFTHAIHRVRLCRNPLHPRNLPGYWDLRKLLRKGAYDIIWTNEPVMGAVTRLAARTLRRSGTRVVYMCHGFHFFDGASPLNWLLYYPVERFLSRFSDCIIIMNREDYHRAQGFPCPNIRKIPGIGIDLGRFRQEASQISRKNLRHQLGIPHDAFLLLSVGELSRRKNHATVLKAMAQWDHPNTHYIICGVGPLRHRLEKLTRKLGLEDRVYFLGYRKDVPLLLSCADCFLFPSRQEGLPCALMEAMSAGLPIVASRIRGNVDLIDDPQGGFLCATTNSRQFLHALNQLSSADTSLMAAHNREKLAEYSIDHVTAMVCGLFQELTNTPKEAL